jgi:hypothetical protein
MGEVLQSGRTGRVVLAEGPVPPGRERTMAWQRLLQEIVARRKMVGITCPSVPEAIRDQQGLYQARRRLGLQQQVLIQRRGRWIIVAAT